ncbi:MAG: OmpA family protein [bacterium]
MVCRRTQVIAGIVAAAALTVPAAHALPWDVGALLGVQLPDAELSGSGLNSSEFPLTIGARGDAYLNDQLGWFADGLWDKISSSKATGDAKMLHGRTGLELLIPNHQAEHQLYIDAGLGIMKIDLDNADSFSRTYWSVGIGKRWAINETMRLHVEVRGDNTVGKHDDAIGKEINQIEAVAGVSWAFGTGKPKVDSDGDGVYDDTDQCPDTPKGARVDSRGCPKDSDGDGVFDGIDKCPDTPKGATVDARGCPSDEDGDGVFDGIDQCPGTPKGVAVDATGCPADEDGDGVLNAQDKCPGTPKGVEVDENGCPKAKPLFKEEKQALILEGVNFEFNSATLTAASSEILDKVAASMVAWPDVKVEVGGHTDNIASADYNMKLSQRRADAVKAYLVSKGVAADRMESKGYGLTQPVASNDTAEGRAKNRRVELKKI